MPRLCRRPSPDLADGSSRKHTQKHAAKKCLKVCPEPPKMSPKSTRNQLKSRFLAKCATRNPLHRHRICEPRAAQEPPKTLKKDTHNSTHFLERIFSAPSSENDSQSGSILTFVFHLCWSRFNLDSKRAHGPQKVGAGAQNSLKRWPMSPKILEKVTLGARK